MTGDIIGCGNGWPAATICRAFPKGTKRQAVLSFLSLPSLSRVSHLNLQKRLSNIDYFSHNSDNNGTYRCREARRRCVSSADIDAALADPNALFKGSSDGNLDEPPATRAELSVTVSTLSTYIFAKSASACWFMRRRQLSSITTRNIKYMIVSWWRESLH